VSAPIVRDHIGMAWARVSRLTNCCVAFVRDRQNSKWSLCLPTQAALQTFNMRHHTQLWE
jgi:hypothetical protein